MDLHAFYTKRATGLVDEFVLVEAIVSCLSVPATCGKAYNFLDRTALPSGHQRESVEFETRHYLECVVERAVL